MSRRRASNERGHAGLVFRSGRDALIRGLNVLSLVSGAAALSVTVALGQQGPLALVATGATLLFAGGMLVYGRRYVSELSTDGGDEATIRLVGFLRPFTRRVPVSALGRGHEHEGRFDSSLQISVNAPWYALPVEDGSTLILDSQAEIFDTQRLQQLLDRGAELRTRR
jgi:hypothetical protein